VGIFNSTPSNYTGGGARSLVVGSNSSASTGHGITIVGGSNSTSNLAFTDNAGDGSANDYRGLFQYVHSDDSLRTFVASSERMRIDSSGNVLVGSTNTAPASNNVDGVSLRINNSSQFSRTDGGAVMINRKTSDGELMRLAKDGSGIGAIGIYSGDLYVANQPFDGAGAGLRYNSGFPNILPCNGLGADRDNAIDLGSSVVRFDDVYATNGTIQTSDRNEKQDIEELTDAEQRVAVAAKGLLRKFRWKDKVAEKGDKARTHFGIIAQDLQAAFEAEGLDAGDYAMFISSTWTDEETGEERTRMGVRYSELLAFIIAAI
jgi:hypothetical protein